MLSMHKNSLLLAGLAGVLFLSDGLAQGLEDIVVTAERREADIQEVPLAVSALSMEQIARLQINQAQDLQRYAPSLNMFNNITQPTNLSPSLRGGLQQDASVVVAESPFGIYVDDIYIGRLNGNNITLSDIERVEVLRGPQGTLYGRNTAYGAIKFVSRTPGEDGWMDFTAGAGNAEQALLKGSIGGPLGDSWAGSVAAQFNTKDGQWFNLSPMQEVGKNEAWAVRSKLRYIGSEKFDAILSVSYADAENDSNQLVNGNSDSNRPPEGCTSGDCIADGQVAQYTTDDIVFTNGPYTTNTDWRPRAPVPISDKPTGFTRQTIVGLTLTYDFSDRLTLKSITGYVDLEDGWTTDFNGNQAATPFLLAGADTTTEQWSQEIQLLGSIGERLDYIFGAFIMNETSDQVFGWEFFNGPLSQSFLSPETDSIAVFGEVNFNFTDELRGTLGLRWTEDDKELDYRFVDVAGMGANNSVQKLTGKYDEVTPRFALDYNLNPDSGTVDSMLLYAQVARGFKGGGFSGITIFGPTPAPYDPETNWTYEFGLKADWAGNRIRTNLAYFFMDVEDIQQNATVTLPGGGTAFPVQNSGDAEIQGLEFELSAVPVDGLNIWLNGSLLDGKYKNLRAGSAAANAPTDWGVKPTPPQLPDYVFDIGFDYTIDIGEGFFSDVTFGADFYKIDNYVTAATNDFFNSGWDQLNGFIAVGIGENWEIKAVGRNLTDEVNVTSGSRALGGYIVMSPREYLFQISYRGAWN
ncbi:MAG: TonB-dependent receptor [Gammaproteobacteria bacterium]|nr:TonB-dependent receptor [Gammaproteobacteria bacterium]